MRKAEKMAAAEYEEEGVGDSSSNRLLNVRKTARELMRVALQSKENESILEDVRPRPSDVLTLLREKERLLREKRACEVELELRRRLSEESLSDATLSVEDLQESVGGLEEEVALARARCSQDQQLLQRLQDSEVLTRHLFQRLHPTAEEKALREVVMRQSKMGVEVGRVWGEVGEGVREVGRLKGERAKLQSHCKELMTQIEASQREHVSNEPTTKETDSLRARLQEKSAECKLLRACLQGLMVGSGVDWSESQELRDLTISLGQAFPWEHN